jgi:hypothetical protein
MGKFKFYQDINVTETRREIFEITADSLEDALTKVVKVSNLNECADAEFIDSDIIESFAKYKAKEINVIL